MRHLLTEVCLLFTAPLFLAIDCYGPETDVLVILYNESEEYALAHYSYIYLQPSECVERGVLLAPNDSVRFHRWYYDDVKDSHVMTVGLLKKSTFESLTKEEVANLDKLDWEKDVKIDESDRNKSFPIYRIYYDGN